MGLRPLFNIKIIFYHKTLIYFERFFQNPINFCFLNRLHSLSQFIVRASAQSHHHGNNFCILQTVIYAINLVFFVGAVGVDCRSCEPEGIPFGRWPAHHNHS